MAEPAAAAPPTAVEVKTVETTTAPAAAEHNPEALEDAKPDARFQNVDLEAQATANAAAAAAPAPTPAADKSTFVAVADSLDWGVLQMMLAFASIVVMISSSTICGGGVSVPNLPFPTGGKPCTGITGYQVAVSTISAIIAIISALLFSAGKIPEKAQEAVSWFQFLWWTAGMIVLTFFGDYITVFYANGYFGTWLAYLFAALGAVQVSTFFRQSVDDALHSMRSPLLLLIVSSAVVMGAAIGPCSPSSACTSYNAFAVSLGTISLIICLVLFFAAPRAPANVNKVFGTFLLLWWVVGFCVVTFGGPFVSPGNGYFASAASVLASIKYFRLGTQQK